MLLEKKVPGYGEFRIVAIKHLVKLSVEHEFFAVFFFFFFFSKRKLVMGSQGHYENMPIQIY